MTRQNWALFREQKKLVHLLLFATPQKAPAHSGSERVRRWSGVTQRTSMHAQESSASRLCSFLETACGYQNRDRTVGAGVLLKFSQGPKKESSPTCWPRAPAQASHASLPAAPQVPPRRRLSQHLAAAPRTRSSPLGSDTIDVPFEIKPGLLPAPSGRLLISTSYDPGYLSPRNFPSCQHTA